MNSIFKFSKQSLSIFLALALLMASAFTGISITANADTQKNIIYWSGEKTAPDETKVDADGNILIYTAEELNYIANTKLSGKSYKIADGIDVIILQPENVVDAETLMGLTDYNAVKTYLTETISATPWCNYSSDPPVFNCNFDGNGVEIYGLYGIGSNVGLFPGIDGGTVYTTEGHVGTVFQNFALRNSYLNSDRRLGVIGAYSAGGIGVGTVNVKNCEVSNCYITSTATTESYFAEEGVLIGRTKGKELVKIDNCLVYGNYNYATGLNKQIPLFSGAYTSDSNAISTVENSVILGTEPYPTSGDSSKTHSVNSYENVYTDQDLSTYTTYTDNDMKKINPAEILGDAAETEMPNLTWDEEWVTVEGKLPALKLFYDKTTSDGGENEGGEGNDTGDTTEGITDTWDGTYTEPTTTDDKGNVIITSAEEFAWVVLKSGANGVGKTYKVQDGITAFYMNENTADLTLEQVKNKLDGNNTNTWEYQSNPFQATLDGNGVTIYGLYCESTETGGSTNSALIPEATGNVAVKNLAVKNSYICGYEYASAIVAYAFDGALTSLTIDQCIVSNNYIAQTRTKSTTSGKNYSVGVLAGSVDARTIVPCYVNFNNCAVYGNELYSGLNANISATIAYFSTKSSTATDGGYQFTNLIISGAAPWCGNHSYHGRRDINFTNVYTDTDASGFDPGSGDTGSNITGNITSAPCDFIEGRITLLDTADMKSATANTNMSDLNWNNIWETTDDFPTLKILNSSVNGEGGEDPDQPDQPDTPQEPEDVKDCAKNIVYWDSTKTDSTLADNGEKGTADDPIIIDSAEELNYLALHTNHDASTQKHYKISDNIDAMILQSEEAVNAMGGAAALMNISSPSAVNKYFEDMSAAGYTPANWITKTNNNVFNGNVDGNGVKIYGMYAVATTGSQSAGLFPVIDGGGTTEITEVETDYTGVYYKDIAIRNSYLSSNRRMGALTGIAYGTNYGAKVKGTVNLDGIEVSNCYLRATGTDEREKGILAGTFAMDLINVNNCLVYNIDASWDKGGVITPITLIGDVTRLVDEYDNAIENSLKNSVVLSVAPTSQTQNSYFSKAENVENVYTDYDISALVSKYSYTDADMKKLTGTTAEAIGNEIGTALNSTGKWLTATGGIPTLRVFHNGVTVVSSTDKLHTVKCDCGVECVDEAHSYDSDYKCLICDYQHLHSMTDVNVESDADCVNGGIMNTKCENCDFVSTREIASDGHSFGEIVPATAGDCKTEATVAYKQCSVCRLNFAADDTDVHSSNPIKNIGTGFTGKHNWVAQEPVTSECSGVTPIEYFKCSVCDTYLIEGVLSTTAPVEIEGHTASSNYFIGEDYHANICVHCGEHFDSVAHTDSNGDNVCEICGWPCGENIFEGASITISDNIAVNYAISKNVIDSLDYDELSIKISFIGKEYVITDYTNDGEYYMFTFDKVAPNRMNDIIYATLCGTKDGASYSSQTIEYSISKYCYNMLEKYGDEQNTKLRTLLVDLLNYGAQAQLYTDYNAENLANANLTETQKTWGTDEMRKLVSHKNLKHSTVENPTVSWKGAGLYLDETATLRFTVKTDDVSGLSAKVVCGEKEWFVPGSEFVLRSDASYYVYVNGIKVTQMSEPIYVTVYDGENAVSNTICYSVESYVVEKYAGTDESLKDLLVAMIKFGDAAKAYAKQ